MKASFALILAASVLLAACGKKAEPPVAPPPANAPAPAAVASPQLQKLLGKWARPDGEYVLEITNVDAGGKLAATYSNPNPINVSKALALQEGATTKVFIELNDTGYPGCTYSLAYDPPSDQLWGQYFQAAMQRTYDVRFERIK